MSSASFSIVMRNQCYLNLSETGSTIMAGFQPFSSLKGSCHLSLCNICRRAAHFESWNISSCNFLWQNENQECGTSKFQLFVASKKKLQPGPLDISNSKTPNGCTPLSHRRSQILPEYLCRALGGDLDEANVHSNLKINQAVTAFV